MQSSAIQANEFEGDEAMDSIKLVQEEDRKASMKYMPEYDSLVGGFPETKKEKILDYHELNHSFCQQEDISIDAQLLDSSADEYHDQMIDLRPYMWHHPM